MGCLKEIVKVDLRIGDMLAALKKMVEHSLLNRTSWDSANLDIDCQVSSYPLL